MDLLGYLRKREDMSGARGGTGRNEGEESGVSTIKIHCNDSQLYTHTHTYTSFSKHYLLNKSFCESMKSLNGFILERSFSQLKMEGLE